jgi:molybdenum cofactor cytidylyltransferase
VLGSDSDLIAPVIQKYEVTTVINHSWEKGMGGSIAAGVHEVMKTHPGVEGVLVTLVDQPLIPTVHFKEMLEAFRPGTRSIIVSRSPEGPDIVPVLFDQCYFRELRVLEGEQGARKITQRYKEHILRIPCGELLEDMDTMASYERLHWKYMGQTGSR